MDARAPLDGWRPALLGALFLAFLSTLGDWIWDRWIPAGQVIHGVVHGAVIFAALGLVLGLAARHRGGGARVVGRAVGGEVVLGILVSASFYPLYSGLGAAALFITWMGLWLGTAGIQRWVDPAPEGLPKTLLRGCAAAVVSGLAFWAVSGIWTAPPPGGPNLPWNFLCWTFAFAPGFLALFLRRADAPSPPPAELAAGGEVPQT